MEGLNVERLIRQAGESGIDLTAISRKGRMMRGCVDEQHLPRLQEMAASGGWRLTIGGRTGAGRLADMFQRRVLLVILCTAATVAAVCASQMMWRVEVIDAGGYDADIRAYLSEQGIQVVRWKHSIDTSALRDALEWRYPEIAWFEVGWRGMTLQVKPVEGVAQCETINTDGSCDVIAIRDGIVASVVTVAGTPMVKAGDIVRAGQVLIAGEERTAEDQQKPVAARGTVLARVWDGASVSMSILERDTVYTGRRMETFVAALPWFDLWPMGASDYAQEDVSIRTMPLGGLFLPTTIRYETHMEANVSLKTRDLEQVKAEAGVAAMRKLRQKIGIDDDLVDKWVDYSMIDSEVLCALAIGERVIDIAQQQRAP